MIEPGLLQQIRDELRLSNRLAYRHLEAMVAIAQERPLIVTEDTRDALGELAVEHPYLTGTGQFGE